MRKLLLLLFTVFLVFNSCIDIPENPVFITVINDTGEKIWVTNFPIPVDMHTSITVQIEQGTEIKAIGVETEYNYGSRHFYTDSVWIVKGP